MRISFDFIYSQQAWLGSDVMTHSELSSEMEWQYNGEKDNLFVGLESRTSYSVLET
jgi:hypothetical protein